MSEMSPVSESNLAVSMMRLFKAMLTDLTGIGAKSEVEVDAFATKKTEEKEEEEGEGGESAEGEEGVKAPRKSGLVNDVKLVNDEELAPTVDAVFVFAIIWAVGGCTDNKGREIFDSVLRKVGPASFSPLPLPLPLHLLLSLSLSLSFSLSFSFPLSLSLHPSPSMSPLLGPGRYCTSRHRHPL